MEETKQHEENFRKILERVKRTGVQVYIGVEGHKNYLVGKIEYLGDDYITFLAVLDLKKTYYIRIDKISAIRL